MSQATKDKMIAGLITVLVSLVAGGGGSFAINKTLADDLSEAKKSIAVMEAERTSMQKTLDNVDKSISELSLKVEKGNDYIRDEVVKAITDLKVDVATLKVRR